MATFEPDTGILNSKPDYTSASKGYKADVSLGSLFEDAGQVLDSGVKLVKSVVQEGLRSEITKAVDSIQDMFTGNGPTPGSGADPAKKVPDDITKRADRLQALTDAYKSGRVNPSHYHMLLDVEARRLRSQYAGHREEIDNIFADLTGGIPANKLITDLQHEAAKKDSGDAEYRKWEFDARKSPAFNAYIKANPNTPPSLAQLKVWSSDVATLEQVQQQEKHGLELKAARRQDVVKDVADLAGPGFQRTFDAEVRGLADGSGLFDRMEALRKQVDDKNTKGIPLANEEQQLSVLVNQLHQRKVDIFNQTMNQEIDTPLGKVKYSTLLGAQGVEEQRKAANAYVDSLTEAVTNKDMGYIGSSLRFATLKKDSNYNRALTDETNQAMVTLRQIYSDQYAGTVINRNTAAIELTNRSVLDLMMGKHSSNTTLAQDAARAADINKIAGGKGDMAVARAAAVNINADMVLDPGVNEMNKKNAIRKLFGDASDANFFSNASPKAQVELYKKLVTPSMAQAIQKHGDAKEKEAYANFVERVTGVRMGQDLQDLRNWVQGTDTTTGIKFDPVTHTFQVEAREQIDRKNSIGFGLSDNNATAREAVTGLVDRLNSTLLGYAPVMAIARKAKPEEINATLANTFKAWGLDLKNLAPDPTKFKQATKPLSLIRLEPVNQGEDTTK